MKICRQLLRRPFYTAAVFVMLAVTGTFFCLGCSIVLSANATRGNIEKSFVSIALPSGETKEVRQELPNGAAYYEKQSVITPEMWEELEGLTKSENAIKEVYKQQFVSAFCPEISTLVSAQEPGDYRPQLDEPYRDVILVVMITDISDKTAEGENAILFGNDKEVTVAIEQAVTMHYGYTLRDQMILYCGFASEEEFASAGLAVGERYIIYGSAYSDMDLLLRTDIAKWKRSMTLKPDDIDLSKVTCDLSEYEEELLEMTVFEEEENIDSFAEKVVAVYPYSDGTGYFLTKDDYRLIDSATLSLWFAGEAEETYILSMEQVDGTIKEISNDVLINRLVMTPLKGELSEFLESDDGVEWMEKIEETKIRHQSVPVIGTDFLEGLYLFQQHKASVVEGRLFSDTDYKKGNRVCLISEQTALTSGLGVGDMLNFSFFWNESSLSKLRNLGITEEYNLMAEEYSRYAGFLQDAPAEYEIIGVYRQSDVWEPFSPYGFTPNTIFVPNASLPSPGYTGQAGVFTTFVLKNGGIDDVKAAIEEKGWPESTLLYYDSGYSEISGTLEGFSGSALWLFAASFLTWAAAMAVYLALFVSGQKRTAGLMLSLGAGKRRTERYLFLISMLPAAAAQLLGAVLGMLFLNGTLQSIFASAGEVMGTGFSGSSVSGHASIEPFLTALPQAALAGALLQAAFCAAAVCLCAKRMVGTKPLKLLR